MHSTRQFDPGRAPPNHRHSINIIIVFFFLSSLPIFSSATKRFGGDLFVWLLLHCLLHHRLKSSSKLRYRFYGGRIFCRSRNFRCRGRDADVEGEDIVGERRTAAGEQHFLGIDVDACCLCVNQASVGELS